MKIQDLQQITLYTGKICGKCHTAKARLKELGVDFTEIPVSSPQSQKQLMKVAPNARTIPVLTGMIDNKFEVVYDVEQLLSDQE